MSLIVDALRRAQEGARRRLPPFGRSYAGVAVNGGAPHRRRVLAIAVMLGVAGVVAASALYLARPKPRGSALQPILVLDTDTREPARQAPPSAGDVRTALESERARAAALESPPPAAPSERPAAPAAPRRTDPRRDEALARVREALKGEAAPAAPPPPVTTAPAPPVSAPAAPPPVVTIEPESNPDAQRFFAAALAYHRHGQLDRAVEEYEKSLAADSRNPAVHNNLGVALKDRGRLELAAQAFEKALALDPKYEKALNNLGVVRFRRGQYDAAIDVFKQALNVNPANVESLTNLGMIYLLAGRYEDALNALQRALQHDPLRAEAHYNLALLWERRGNRDSARRHYQRFLELASSQHAPLVAQVKERLDFLVRGR